MMSIRPLAHRSILMAALAANAFPAPAEPSAEQLAKPCQNPVANPISGPFQYNANRNDEPQRARAATWPRATGDSGPARPRRAGHCNLAAAAGH